MQKLIVLFVILVFPFVAAAVDTSKNMTTKAGTLTIETAAEGNIHSINLNGKTIHQDKENESLSFDKTFALNNADVILLLQNTGGSACPGTYRLLTVKSAKQYHVSESFGNCSDVPKIQQKGEKIVITFPRIGDAQAETVIYKEGKIMVIKR